MFPFDDVIMSDRYSFLHCIILGASFSSQRNSAHRLPIFCCQQFLENHLHVCHNLCHMTWPKLANVAKEKNAHRSPVNSPPKGQWRGALMFSFNLRLNKRLSEAGDLRRHLVHYDVTLMHWNNIQSQVISTCKNTHFTNMVLLRLGNVEVITSIVLPGL